jgi:nucleoside-diphosphate-sugar epimerase
MTEFSDKINSEDQLEEILSRPGDKLKEMLKRVDGDILILGISGKIGASLAKMAKRACDMVGIEKRILGVGRTIDPIQKKCFDDMGIDVMQGDLLDSAFFSKLPTFRNVFFLAGMKFGSVENLPLTWAVNTFIPAIVAEHFRNSRIVAFSTGCVYPLVSIKSGGSVETDMPVPTGEYAQSCLGRERMFEYGSQKYGTEVILIRLNYSVEMRYGVLVDIALKVKSNIPLDLTMGYFNVIWQGDMNDFILRSVEHVKSPARILNITGADILSVREVALEFGKLFGTSPRFIGVEADTSLLNNASEAFKLFGRPKVRINQIINWTAGWLVKGNRLLGKPTHFEVRDGNF